MSCPENVGGASAPSAMQSSSSRKRKSDARPEGCPKKKANEEKGIRVTH